VRLFGHQVNPPNLWVSNSQLSRHWKLDKPTAMRFPAVTFENGMTMSFMFAKVRVS
jgi:hypothetical protein